MSHKRFELRVDTGEATANSWTLAITIHAPDVACFRGPRPVLVTLPGGRYTRHYFDLREPGYSEAEFHVARGVVVIAIDHLGVGDSDIPSGPLVSLEYCAEVNHAALTIVLDRLRHGQIDPSLSPIELSAVIGAGQSMGGHIALLMQANHNSFDALAMLGSSVTCTRLPGRGEEQSICSLGKTNANEALAAIASFDFRFAFHWDDVPEHLVKADMESKQQGGDEIYWTSKTSPDAGNLMQAGAMTGVAARIRVPTLVAMGERDVCQDSLRELAAYMSARDIALFIAPKMAHMHNFAGTRQLMWRRIAAFIEQVELARGVPDDLV